MAFIRVLLWSVCPRWTCPALCPPTSRSGPDWRAGGPLAALQKKRPFFGPSSAPLSALEIRPRTSAAFCCRADASGRWFRTCDPGQDSDRALLGFGLNLARLSGNSCQIHRRRNLCVTRHRALLKSNSWEGAYVHGGRGDADGSRQHLRVGGGGGAQTGLTGRNQLTEVKTSKFSHLSGTLLSLICYFLFFKTSVCV